VKTVAIDERFQAAAIDVLSGWPPGDLSARHCSESS
jgi:hypothetical protein